MKTPAALTLALFGFSSMAMAQGGGVSTDDNSILVEQYSYGMRLDVAKVISRSDVPDVCNVVPARMTYDDSQGKRHILAYQILGTGCSND